MTDRVQLSAQHLCVIVAAILGIGLCTIVAGLVPSWCNQTAPSFRELFVFIQLASVAMGLAGITVGISVHGVHKRAAALRRAELAFRENARLDPLTKTLNRSSFLEVHEEQVRLAQQGEPMALFVLDLDRFKEANDTHGHAMGDAVLRHIGSVLQWELDGAIIGRLGGDEFAFILPGLGSKSICEKIGKRVLRTLQRPVRLGSVLVETNASIGVAWSPEHGSDADELMRFADLALYAAKANGRGSVRCFDRDLAARQQRRLTIERALAEELRAGGRQLQVHYQPIISEGGAAIHGVEALLRWRHPEHGFIAPSEFIPIAEDIGLIDKLGQLVFDRALSEAQSWPQLTLNVNVSPAQLRTKGFAADLCDRIAAAGFDPRRLFLEITEGVLLESGEDQLSQINHLRSIGVKFSLDDFGSGYSSLAYLRRFPLDQIKIDRSYILTLPSDPRSGVLVSAICELGRGLNLNIVAEGVETEEHLMLVKAAGCTNFQGYHFAQPMPADRLRDYLAGRTRPSDRPRLQSVA
ncbi:MAG: EAL domain-containing protein [Methylobacteriaceae bacterium]|nr:EAL domain-containing protein [Methylobacteriaceae bacterium]MBV9637350.1 EAL domain-containing protein [Methylobacteriaceae bacterium]MBV9702535.1 EAL domain-containing protein [Methylobacteriaceae bacterium]